MSDERSHSEALEASLSAARREADALREQIQVSRPVRHLFQISINLVMH